MSEKEDLGLNEGEKVLLQTKAIEDNKLVLLNIILIIIFGIVGILLLIIGFYYLVPDEEYPNQYLAFYGFLSFSILLCFATMIGLILISYYSAKITFYITSKRILKVRNKYFSFRRAKTYQISFPNISHLIDWNCAIEIIPKKSNGEGYYRGDETDFSHKIWGLKAILIRLNRHKGKKLITKAIDILTKEGPLRQHPNMDFLYINS